jgi:HD-like signal output (HDOD) protein
MAPLRRDELLKSLRIPTLPSAVARLTELIDTPDAGSAEVGALIKQDPPLAGKVLRIANSSFYGLHEPCTSIEQASAVLGLRLLRNIVVQTALIDRYAHLQELGLDIEQLWRRSVLVGQAASILSRRSRGAGLPGPDEAYLTGLLSDVGQVVLLDNLGEKYAELQLQAMNRNQALFLAERRDLGTTHADAGAIAAASWVLPNSVRVGIQLHHGRREADFAIPPVYLVIRAGRLVDCVLAGDKARATEEVDARAEQTLGITGEAVAEAIEHVHANLRSPLSEAA